MVPVEEKLANVLEVYAHYRTYHRRAHPCPLPKSKEWRQIQERFNEGHTVRDLCDAIDGIHCSVYHVRKRYLHLDLIVRSASNVNRFMEMLESKESALSDTTSANLQALGDVLSTED